MNIIKNTKNKDSEKNKDNTVRVIIVTRNNENIISKCLDSLFNQKYPHISVTIIDDASKDGTFSLINKKYPQIRVIRNKKVLGPAKSRNIALFESGESYIVFMDSDAFIEPEWIRNAIVILKDNPMIGVLGGKVYNTNGTIQSVGTFFHVSGVSGMLTKPEINNKKFLWLPSSTFIMPTKIAKKIGGFDENYFYHYEDLDICWRTNIAGYDVVFNKKLRSIHGIRNSFSTTIKKEFSQKEIDFMTKRNKMITLLKNLDIIDLVKNFPIIFFFWLGEVIFLPNKFSVIRGNLSSFFYLPYIIKERKKIKRYKKRNYTYLKKFSIRKLSEIINICLKNN